LGRLREKGAVATGNVVNSLGVAWRHKETRRACVDSVMAVLSNWHLVHNPYRAVSTTYITTA